MTGKKRMTPSCIDRRTADAVRQYGGRMQTAGKQEVTPEVLMDAVDKI